MLVALRRLWQLWALILFLASACFIADVISINSSTSTADLWPLGVPFAADVATLFIFSYGLWSRNQSYLLSMHNCCCRWTRHFGTCLLAAGWCLNSVLYSELNKVAPRKVMAGVAALMAILILVEMVGSHRLTREQRRLLIEERMSTKMLKKLERGEVEDDLDRSSFGGAAHSNSTAITLAPRPAIKAIEYVRPEAVDPKALVQNQLLQFELYQRFNQQLTPSEEVEESSFKVEVPLDTPMGFDVLPLKEGELTLVKGECEGDDQSSSTFPSAPSQEQVSGEEDISVLDPVPIRASRMLAVQSQASAPPLLPYARKDSSM